ncbi:hypothetical protein CXB51_008456 [Gossypium anomalum]|uniref:Integrase catalytic domain-containing protein n=1 Tax=Gossypium anomalum TaxID=47600 RepID=A0A8J5ZDA6_9ROSI|nr:hypothetical protein CXB51_008456 [Gossypium anomalum]
MTAVMHCLRTWRHYLLGSRFVVLTNNVANSYFLTQKKLSPKQARWQVAKFDFTMEYKQGSANIVADALSRKMEFTAISQPDGSLLERIREGLSHDPAAKSLIDLAKEGKTRRFWLGGELLYTHGHCLYVLHYRKLRKEVMKEYHDSKWAGHLRMHCTLAILEDRYYLPHMGEDVKTYVKTCLVCQQDKSDGFASILVVVDMFSKYATFIPATKECHAEEGVPVSIINDRDWQFTGWLWTELFKSMGSDLNFFISMHPQTNGQTKRVNALLETYLQHYVSATPFEIVTGQQPLTPNTVTTRYTGPNPDAYQFSKDWQGKNDLARACLHKASKRNKKWANQNRRDVQF